MIKLDITSFIFYYILLSAIVILTIWLFFGYRRIKGPTQKDVDFIWKCSVCFNDYIDSKHDEISVCPLCGSYNKKKDLHLNAKEVEK
ncbi:MAG: hypothetical protein WC779_01170 [Candidatus Omnitrophota bacterium]|jgi:rRNA maturation endonuclease Nob1